MDKKHQKCPLNGVFPLFMTPQFFFQKSGSVAFVPYSPLLHAKKWKILMGGLLRQSKTDQRMNKQTRVMTKDPYGKLGVQNLVVYKHMSIYIIFSLIDFNKISNAPTMNTVLVFEIIGYNQIIAGRGRHISLLCKTIETYYEIIRLLNLSTRKKHCGDHLKLGRK